MATDSANTRTVVETFIKARGDASWLSTLLTRNVPEISVINMRFHGYAHRYVGQEDPSQELSLQMRELIATVLLVYRGSDEAAANHIRKLYRHGVTSSIVIEAFMAAAPALGWANAVHGMGAVHRANDPSFLEGALPPDGPPQEVADFPELHLGEGHPEARAEDTGLSQRPEWQYIAEVDPILAERAAAYYNRLSLDGGVQTNDQLPPAARELVAIAALCARGAVEMAAEHMQRARRYGVTARQILEAIEAALPMTGMPTIEFGAQAMMKAGIKPGT